MTLTQEGLQPRDVRDVAAVCSAAMRPGAERDWGAKAGDLEWSAQQTLDHMVGALLSYAIHLASRAPARVPGPATRPAGYAIESLPAMAAVLAAVAEAAQPDARGWHHLGMADRTGFIGMGCDEMLIHTDDITQGFGIAFQPPEEVCRRVVARLFPWAPTNVDPWSALRWANGRLALPDRARLGPDWGWWCAPLSEWNGTVTRSG